MKKLNYDELSRVILDFSSQSRPVLFTGAGIGKKVDFPLWNEYLDGLAEVCKKFGDEDSAILMRRKIKVGNLVGAAGIFEDCQDIPVGERWKNLASPFRNVVSDEKLDLLHPLFALPFGGIITTNYDHSQHDASARVRGRSPIQIELEGKSMLGGADQTGFFIARIHGSAESPSSMVLYPSSYRELNNNVTYCDFLINLFRDRPCLFVGFSFVDPAIDHVLSTYSEKRQQHFETPHAALLPSDGSGEIHKRLSNLGIKAYFYDASDNHKDLWKAFRKAAGIYERSQTLVKKDQNISVLPCRPEFQHFLAFTYAQQKVTAEARPVLEQARDGIVLSSIRGAGAKGLASQTLNEKIRDVLSLDEKESNDIAKASTARLFTNRDIRIEGEILFAVDQEQNEIDEPMGVLVDGILNRLKVRESMAPSEGDSEIAYQVVEQALMVRAWDLAAHWAGGGSGFGDNLYSTVRDIVAQFAVKLSEKRRLAMERCAVDLLTLPTEDEAEHLAELSRAAFSLQLVLSSPRQSLLQRYSLPQKVYFDASVLMPAIVSGHPLSALYMSAIHRLQEASKQAGISVKLCVGQPFLNEIIAHRDLGIQIAEQQKLDDISNLNKVIAFYGAEYTNVFIGAYAGFAGANLAAGKGQIGFRKFLQLAAPYTNETKLGEYLSGAGFSVVPMDFRKHHNHEFVTCFNALLGSYSELGENFISGKSKLLVEHEAKQIIRLHLDKVDGVRSVFVSNDRKLRRAAMIHPETRSTADSMLPPDGFIGLIDIIVGIKADRSGLARLIWAVPRRDADRAIRDYFVRRGLEERDAAMAKAVPKVIEEIVDNAMAALEKRPVNISDGNNPDAILATTKFVDRLEREFYQKMGRVLDKAEKS